MSDIPNTIHTFSNEMVAPLNLDPGQVRVIDIAEQLGKQVRFSGATGSGKGWEPVRVEVAPGWFRTIPAGLSYTVAQHATLASIQVEKETGDIDLAWDSLHHDDAEYVLQDMVRPLKVDEAFGQRYRGAETRVEKVLGPLLDVTFPMLPKVKESDERMLVTEADQLLHGRADSAWNFYRDTYAYDITITPWNGKRAVAEWLKRCLILADARGFELKGNLGHGLERA